MARRQELHTSVLEPKSRRRSQPARDLQTLGLFGGKPAFKSPLYVGRPNLGSTRRLTERLRGILERRWLTNRGPEVQEFERRMQEYLGVKHCIAICNATVALEIVIRALGLEGEVIVPAFTFVATAHALQWQQITPVFCDIRPDTHTIDPDRIEAHITPRTSGIIGVHLWGQGCDIEPLERIAQKHRLKLMFDAAHAFGCSHGGRLIGGFGRAEVFSFHATKFLNSFEGGAIATNEDALAEKIRLMTNFGFAGFDNVIYVGTNGKMSEISAAMGLTSLESIDEIIATNRANYGRYAAGLKGLPGVRLFPYPEDDRCNYQYLVVEIDASIAGLHRDWILEMLHAENVIARRYFYPGVHRMQPYRSLFPHARLLLPQTEALSQRVLILPTGTSVGAREIERVCGLIRDCLANREEFQRRAARVTRRVTPDLT